MRNKSRRFGGAAPRIGILLWVLIALAPRLGLGEDARPPEAESKADAKPTPAATAPATNPLDAQRAFGYLQEICAFGPRPSGSPAMEKQQAYLKDYFEKLGGKVSFQKFLANNPLGGDKVPMANLLVEWHPERKERILFCAHYDTRPLPDRDLDPEKRKNGPFIGANDGGSGVAVLMELAHLMKDLQGPVGVDFLLVDGEELVYQEKRDPYFLGTTWFAQKYAKEPPMHKYRWGVVLDMVGGRDFHIYKEHFSNTWHDTKPVVKEIWDTAARLGVKEFMPREGYYVQDDHFPLRNIAKIPTCDVIDFSDSSGNSPPGYWHTSGDTIQRCTGSSLAKVGWVMYEWLKSQEAESGAQ